MGHFRFRKSFGNKFFRLNVSKSGLSLTSGVPGVHVNTPIVSTRKRKGMVTLGLPGTGLSYRQQIGESGMSPRRGDNGNELPPFSTQTVFFIIGFIILAAMYLVYFS
jgi:hypothetical protein